MSDTEKQLRKLYELSLLLSGEPDEIIRQIAAMIAEFFDVRVVVLTEIKNQELYFLCAYVDGELKTELGHVPLEFTPCALVKAGKQARFFDQVSEIFPQVDFLKQQKAFFYYGVPAMDSAGNVISTTCLLDEKHHDLSEQSVELLRIFGQRIAMELERQLSITDKKKQELENESIRMKLMEAQNIAHLGFFEHEIDTGNTYWSEETYRLLGTDPQQTSPGFETFLSFVHPDDAPLVLEAREQLRHGGRYDIDYRIIKPDGSESILHGEAKLYVDEKNQLRKIIGTIQDISERKHVESALNALAKFSVIDDMSTFYKSMAYNLACAYNAQFAFIGLFAEGSADKIALQAIWAGDDFAEVFDYELLGTPCADVLNHQMEMVQENAASLYPEDAVLTELDIESYYGVPLITPSGKKLGLMAVMDTKPMHMGHWTKSILSLFAQQLASHIEHSRAEEEIKASQKKLSSILENMLDVYSRTDSDGLLTMMSPSGTAVLGYEIEEILGTPLADLYINPEDRNKLLQMLSENNGCVHNFTAALRHKDGHAVWMSSNVQYYYDEQGNMLGVEGVTRDVTRQYLDELQMRKMSSALEQTADMVLIADKEGIIEYVNPMFEKISGYCKHELIGKKPSILKSGRHNRGFYKNLWSTILRGEVFTEVMINKKQDGSLFYQDETITPLKNEDGEITHFIATGRDISQRMENEKRLQHIAHHDALTGLPNRVLFMDRIKRSLAHARRNSERAAVLFFDLDRFKTINDTLGHNIGDKLLVEIAHRLKKAIREDDSVARLGGDEFAVLVDKIHSENDITQIARKTLSCIEKSAIIEGHSLYTTVSIGISLFPEDGEDADTLLKNADIAMYRAKDLGKNNYQFYSKDMSARAIQRLAMENSLRMALKKNEFVLYYQAQVNTKNQTITGVEALIRWQHPELGLVAPSDFVPLLEETGLIGDVGDWVLETACQQLKNWTQSGHTDLAMSINVSGRQFHSQAFYKRMVALTEKYNISAERIELEITESILMDKQKQTIENINKLDSYGFRMAIDDFGTGYSSLSYLQRFKIDTLKIDRSFIRDIVTNPDDASITSAIIAMAHSLKLNIVAEGVETREQLDFLQQHGCQQIQGYFFSRPLIASDMTQLLHGGIVRCDSKVFTDVSRSPDISSN